MPMGMVLEKREKKNKKICGIGGVHRNLDAERYRGVAYLYTCPYTCHQRSVSGHLLLIIKILQGASVVVVWVFHTLILEFDPGKIGIYSQRTTVSFI